MHRRAVLFAGLSVFAAPAAVAQQDLFGRLTQRDAAAGVTEVLGIAATNSTSRLARPNGFFGDPVVHIPLPQRFASLQRTLRPMGLAGPFDDLERRINTAAEEAMPEAGRIFMNVIRSITIADAITVLRGGERGATRFLRNRTEGRLTTLLTPPMRRTLTGAGAFRVADSVAGRFGLRDVSRSLRDDVTVFAVGKALDGAFHYIGEEEAAIRRDPWRRTTDILRRVFGP